MREQIRILHLEDLPDDAELVARELKKSGIQCDILHAENKGDFISALKEFLPDVILCDHSLISFDSHEALMLLKEMGIKVPFILVTATVSDEYAVSLIKEGASDYILKDRLQRLPNSILSALQKYQLEQEKKIADERLRASEQKYKLLFASNPMPMWVIAKPNFDIIDVNEAAIGHYGYSRVEFLNMNARDLRPAEEIQKYEEYIANKKAANKSGIWRHKKKDGSILLVDIIANDFMYENQPARLILANDVTEKIKAEDELNRQRVLQQKLIAETGLKVQERERNEIGKELHDNINQILATAKMYLDLAINEDEQHSEMLHNIQKIVVLAIDEIRQLSHSLVAPSLGNQPLVKTIGDLLGRFRKISALEIQFKPDHFDEHSVDDGAKLMLYRIVQEQFNNIFKHAQAKQVLVELYTISTAILLKITDDGIGFNYSQKPEGIGLRNIRNRVEFYDGSVKIISLPGKGCTLEISIPISPASNEA